MNSVIKILTDQNQFNIDSVSVCYTNEYFKNPDIIWLEKNSLNGSQFILSFGRGAAKAMVSEEDAKLLSNSLGIKIIS